MHRNRTLFFAMIVNIAFRLQFLRKMYPSIPVFTLYVVGQNFYFNKNVK